MLDPRPPPPRPCGPQMRWMGAPLVGVTLHMQGSRFAAPISTAPPPPPPALWDTDACARPVPSGTKQKCKAKVKEKSSSVTCHRRLSLQ